MNVVLPDFLFPAVVFLDDNSPERPLIITILIYSSNQPTPLYTAWFHGTTYRNITVYYKDKKWIEKEVGIETVNSKAIGIAIENYNPLKS